MGVVNTLPKEYQARRTFKGLLPEYYERVELLDSGPATETVNFYHNDFKTGATVLCCTILITYTDSSKKKLSVVERTYPPITAPL